MNATLTPVAAVHYAITTYRSMYARHFHGLNEHCDAEGVIDGQHDEYDDKRYEFAVEADYLFDNVMSLLTEQFGLPTDRPVAVLGANGFTYDVTPGLIDDAARRAFTEGQCHALALALTEMTGWPATALLTVECSALDEMCSDAGVEDDTCPCRIGHIVVTRPDGAHIDIDGAHAPGTIPDCEDAPAIPMTEEMWAAVRDASTWRQADLHVARTLVKPLLASLTT
ncbi:hypothetical protein [Streptomyces sp. MBT27]|uniref:hypothetical protein n=1 Tax=Streptomyces sp. MBT27 TaxID=1488356 RepID=UPI00142217AB|nr:hypothetical protein [Streptomyces sp. MBT27]